MRLLFLACATLPLSASPAEPARSTGTQKASIRFVAPSPDKLCPEPMLHRNGPRPEAELRKLNELPPPNAYHAVFRRGPDGCLDPLLVGYQYRKDR